MAIPDKDSQLVPYIASFNSTIAVSPTVFGLTAADASRLDGLVTDYTTTYNAMMQARAAGTRSQSQTAATQTAKTNLLAFARQLYSTVQANAAVSAADKTLLGVVVRSDSPKPVPAPTTAPTMTIDAVVGRSVTVSVYDPTKPSRRSKAPGASYANVYVHVGASYPSDPTAWQFNGPATKATYTIEFPANVASGSQVWACSSWVNRRGQSGPSCEPVSTYLQGGGTAATPVAATDTLKIAA